MYVKYEKIGVKPIAKIFLMYTLPPNPLVIATPDYRFEKFPFNTSINGMNPT